MVAQTSQHNRGGYAPRFAQPQRDPNAPKPEAKVTGTCPWRVVHSYRMGEGYSDITAIAVVTGGILVRTTSKSSKGCSQALVFVPGGRPEDFGVTMRGGAR